MERSKRLLELRVGEKEKEHTKLLKLDELFRADTEAARKAMEEVAKLDKLKDAAKADANRLAAFMNGREGGDKESVPSQGPAVLNMVSVQGQDERYEGLTVARCQTLDLSRGLTRRTPWSKASQMLRKSRCARGSWSGS